MPEMPSILELVAVTISTTASVCAVLTLAIDAETWRSSRSCEAASVCNHPSALLSTQRTCVIFDENLSLLFRFYSVAVPASISKCILVAICLSAHHNESIKLLQDSASPSHARTMWILLNLLDIPMAASVMVRYAIIGSHLGRFSETLFPETEASVGIVLMVSTMLFAILPVLVNAYSLGYGILKGGL